MKRLDFRSVVVVLLAAAAGCKGDPTADLRGGASSLAFIPDLMFIDEGDARPFEVTIRDQQLNPVSGPLQVSSTDPLVFTVAADTVATSADSANYNFNVTALAPGQAKLVATSGSVTDSATITVLPLSFTGALSTTTPIVGNILVLRSTSLLGFDPATANVDFGGGVLGEVLGVTADSLAVRVPQPDGIQPAPVTVEGTAVKYVPGLVVPLPTSTALNVTPIGDRETPGTVIITPPASGGPDLVFWDGFKSGANGSTSFIDYFYQFTLAVQDTLTFRLDWDSEADIDMANLRTNFTIIGGLGAATGANPETYTVIFPPGTYHLLVESFDDHDDPAHLFKVTIRNP